MGYSTLSALWPLTCTEVPFQLRSAPVGRSVPILPGPCRLLGEADHGDPENTG